MTVPPFRLYIAGNPPPEIEALMTPEDVAISRAERKALVNSPEFTKGHMLGAPKRVDTGGADSTEDTAHTE